ncbi:MAG: hypothetical protein IT167_17580 [Bryobacterales bacterium]|nr:hypothetical protein [Bryobacterales bacterium]
MIIRKTQFEFIANRREQSFARRQVPFFRELWKDRAAKYDDSELAALLAGLIREAHSFGITGDQLVMRYASFQFGFRGRLSDPARSPQTAAILRDFHLTGEEKVERLADWIARLSDGKAPASAEK